MGEIKKASAKINQALSKISETMKNVSNQITVKKRFGEMPTVSKGRHEGGEGGALLDAQRGLNAGLDHLSKAERFLEISEWKNSLLEINNAVNSLRVTRVNVLRRYLPIIRKKFEWIEGLVLEAKRELQIAVKKI